MNKALFKTLITTFLVASSANSEILLNANKFNHLFIKFGKMYDVPPTLLWAIAKTESGLNEKAFNDSNKDGSSDRGLMQVNSIHENKLRARNLNLDDLYTPEINIEFGAMILKTCLDKYGMNYKALNCYNGKIKNNPYSRKVIANLGFGIKTKDKIIIK